MQEMVSCLNVLLFTFLWTSPLKLCQCSNTDCDFTESYDEVVTVSRFETVYVTKYKWCLNIPPRCPDDMEKHYRTILKNITIPKMRKVRRCCKDQIQLYDNCIPKCAKHQCPNIQCAPGTDKCKCQPGYIGHLCGQKCDFGYWGVGCKNACHKACPDCEHRTGCCKARPADDHRATVAGLIFCGPNVVAQKSENPVSLDDDTTEHKNDSDTDRSSRTTRFWTQSSQSTQTRELEAAVTSEVINQKPVAATAVMVTQEPVPVTGNQSAAKAMVEEVSTSESSSPPTPSSPSTPKRLKDIGVLVGTMTKMEVTVYKYDELVKKLIWISAMTVFAIAMVFVIMFVVFFNCYGMSKMDDDRNQEQRSTSAAANKSHETCTKNLSPVPPNRYIKNPSLHKSSINDDLPVHPEIFCPVFSAPHFTGTKYSEASSRISSYSRGGSTLYDSPQPLYEILC